MPEFCVSEAPYITATQCFWNSLFLNFYVPEPLSVSGSSVSEAVYVPECLYYSSSVFRELFVPESLRSLNYMIPKSDAYGVLYEFETSLAVNTKCIRTFLGARGLNITPGTTCGPPIFLWIMVPHEKQFNKLVNRFSSHKRGA